VPTLKDKKIKFVPYIFLLASILPGCSFVHEKPSEQLPPASSRILKLNYDGFTLWLDCNRRGAVKFRYNAQRDAGSFKRNSRFFLDPNVPSECQQTSTKAYGSGYDRGHLVPANHLDYSASAIKAANTMTNILPQASTMNREAWELTEEIIECYRTLTSCWSSAA